MNETNDRQRLPTILHKTDGRSVIYIHLVKDSLRVYRIIGIHCPASTSERDPITSWITVMPVFATGAYIPPKQPRRQLKYTHSIM